VLRRSYVVLCSKVALLVIGVGIVVGIALRSGNTATTNSGDNSVGTMYVRAFYATGSDTAGWTGGYVAVVVSVSGPENTSGTTTTSGSFPSPPGTTTDVLTFSLTPGTYTVSGTYNGIFKSENVTVTQGEGVEVFLNFGESPPPP